MPNRVQDEFLDLANRLSGSTVAPGPVTSAGLGGLPKATAKEFGAFANEFLQSAQGPSNEDFLRSAGGGLLKGALGVAEILGNAGELSAGFPALVRPFDETVSSRAAELGRRQIDENIFQGREPGSTTERFIRLGAEAVGGELIPAGAVLGSSTQLKRIGGARRFLSSELASIAGEAVGRTFAQEAFPGQVGVEAFFGITGAVGTGLAGGTARNVKDKIVQAASKNTPERLRFLSPIAEESARNQVARSVQGVATVDNSLDRVKRNLDQAIALSEEIEGFTPTSAQAARSSGLNTAEKIEATQDPSFSQTALDQKSRSEVSVIEEIRRRTPVGDEESLRIFLDDRNRVMVDAMERVIDDAVDDLRTEIINVTKGELGLGAETLAARQTATTRVFDAIANARARVMEPINRGYAKLSDLAHERNIRVIIDTPDSESTFGVLRRWERFVGNERRGLPKEFIKDIEDMGPRPRFGRVWKLNVDIGDALQREGITATEKKFLVDLKKGVKADLDRFEADGITGQGYAVKAQNTFSDQSIAATMLRKLNEARAEVGKKFDDGVVGVARSTFGGKFPEKATLGAFFRAGEGGDLTMKRFLDATRRSDVDFPNDIGIEDLPVARELMLSYIVSQAIKASIDNADTLTLSTSRLAAFKVRHAEALSAFPEASEQLNGIGKLQKRVDAMRDRLKIGRADMEREIAQTIVNKPVKTVFNQIFNAGTPGQQAQKARELLRQVGESPPALAGARRILWDELVERLTGTITRDTGGTIERIEPNAIQQMLRKNRGVIRILFGEQHARDLETTFRTASQIAKATTRPLVTGTPRISLIENVRLRALIAPIYGAFQRGVRGAEAASVFMDNLSGVHRRILYREALLDPKIMRGIMDQEVNGRVFVRRMRLHLLTLGARVGNDGKPLDDATTPPAERSLTTIPIGRGIQ